MPGIISNSARRYRRAARANNRTRGAAAVVKDELGRDGQSVIEKCGINPPLEALPRVAGQRELLPRACDMLRSKIGAFDQHVGCGVGHTRMFAAHNAADIVHHHVIGDHCHACT